MHKLRYINLSAHKVSTGWALENSSAANIVLFPVFLTSGKLSEVTDALVKRVTFIASCLDRIKHFGF